MAKQKYTSEQRERRRLNSAAWRARNKEQQAQYFEAYNRVNAEKLRANAKARYASNPERFKAEQKKYRVQQRDAQRRRKGLPVPTRPEPINCECCHKPFLSLSHPTPHIDHDHTTGAFRGWICNRCNTGLGLLGDTVDAILFALDYLLSVPR